MQETASYNFNQMSIEDFQQARVSYFYNSINMIILPFLLN